MLSATTGMIKSNIMKGSDTNIGAFLLSLDFKLLDTVQENNAQFLEKILIQIPINSRV